MALAILVLATGFAASPAAAERLPTISPLATEVIAPPEAVRGTDKRWHLVYEIALLNTSNAERRIDRVVVRGGGKVRASYEGTDAVGEIISAPSHPFDPIDSLPPSGGGTLWLDATFGCRKCIPKKLGHRLTTTPLATDGSVDGATTTMVGSSTAVIRAKPVVIGPPFRGSDYVNTNGCCGLGAHRRALFTFEGTRVLSQRFAIDWVKLGAEGRWWSGDPTQNSSYPIFGTPIIASSAGTVVATRSDLPQNTPPNPLSNLTIANALGNQVTVDMGGGLFAIYAHMRSVAVEVGDRVRRGERLGRVGNSGGSGAPHLHFQITEGLRGGGAISNGVPFELTRFRNRGRILNYEAFLDQESSNAAVIEAQPPPPRRLQLPMQANVVDFP